VMEHEQPSPGASRAEPMASHWYLHREASLDTRTPPSSSLIARLRTRQPTVHGTSENRAFATQWLRATRRPQTPKSTDVMMQTLRRTLELMRTCERSVAREPRTPTRPAALSVPAVDDEVLSCVNPRTAVVTPGFKIYVDTPLRKARVLQVTDDEDSEGEGEDSDDELDEPSRVVLGEILDVNVI